MLTRLESRHVHEVGINSSDDIYAGLTTEGGIDKFVRSARPNFSKGNGRTKKRGAFRQLSVGCRRITLRSSAYACS